MSRHIFDSPVGPSTIAATYVINLNTVRVEKSEFFDVGTADSFKTTITKVASHTISKTLTRMALPSAGYAASNWTIPNDKFVTIRFWPRSIHSSLANPEYPTTDLYSPGNLSTPSLPYFRNVETHISNIQPLAFSPYVSFPTVGIPLINIYIPVVISPALYYTVTTRYETFDLASPPNYTDTTTTTNVAIHSILFSNSTADPANSQWYGTCFLGGTRDIYLDNVPFKVGTLRRQSDNSLDIGGTQTITVANPADTGPGIYPSLTHTGTQTYTFTVTTS